MLIYKTNAYNGSICYCPNYITATWSATFFCSKPGCSLVTDGQRPLSAQNQVADQVAATEFGHIKVKVKGKGPVLDI